MIAPADPIGPAAPKPPHRGAFDRKNAFVDQGWLAVLTPVQKDVWIAIERSANQDGDAYPGAALLAGRIYGVTTRSRINHVRIARADLASFGLLRFAGDGNPDHVQMMMPTAAPPRTSKRSIAIDTCAPKSGAERAEIGRKDAPKSGAIAPKSGAERAEIGRKVRRNRVSHKEEQPIEHPIEQHNQHPRQNVDDDDEAFELNSEQRRREELKAELIEVGIVGAMVETLSKIPGVYAAHMPTLVFRSRQITSLQSLTGWIIKTLQSGEAALPRGVAPECACKLVNLGVVESVAGEMVTGSARFNDNGIEVDTEQGKKMIAADRLSINRFKLKPIAERRSKYLDAFPAKSPVRRESLADRTLKLLRETPHQSNTRTIILDGKPSAEPAFFREDR